MSIDPNEFLMGGGVKSAAFPTIGATVTGCIVRTPEVRQQTDANDNSPKFFPNGDPMMQLIVQLATDQRDPANPEDDGTRALYIKSNMLSVVRDAVRKSGAKGLETGGVLTVAYVGDGEKKGKLNAPKFYAANYSPAQAEVAASFLNGGGQPAAAPAALAAQIAAPAPQVANVAPAGVPQAIWDQMAGEQRTKLLAALATAAQ